MRLISPSSRPAGRATALVAIVALVTLGGPVPAAADAELATAVVFAETSSIGFPGSDSCEEPVTDSALCTASSTGTLQGASGSGSVRVEATLGYDDLDFLTSVSTVGNAGGQATASIAEPSRGSGTGGLLLSFDVVNTATVIVQGSLAVAGDSACSQVTISSAITHLDVRAPGSACGGSSGVVRSSLDEEVRLPAGTYQLRVVAWGGGSVPVDGGTIRGRGRFDLDILLRTCDNEFTDGPDLITGTSGRDFLCGGPGDDDIFGLGGNDRILGGPGNDTIEGGPGNDVIDAGAGDDEFVDGGSGADRIDGGPGSDGRFITVGMSFTGGDGNDRLIGGDGTNTMSGGPGADILVGGPDSDFFNGDGGDDTLMGGEGGDSLYGGGGNDEIEGGPGHEVAQQGRLAGIDGGPGDDVLSGGGGDDLMEGRDGADAMGGGNGADKLRGGADDDGIIGGAGRDVLVGGDGADDLTSRDGVRDDVIGGPGHDSAGVDPIDSVNGVEDVTR